ncbi:MAG: hypothetical protein ACTHKG_11300 [Nocardioides sp.]
MTGRHAAASAGGTTDLAAGLDADDLRSGDDRMREGLGTVVGRGTEAWTGPLDELVAALHEVARVDLALARLVEGHADAMRILAQAGVSAGPGVYGVWASRSAGTGAAAVDEGGEGGGRWRLTGEVRFASGIGLIDRALVPGWVDAEHHLLFDVAVTDVVADRSTWQTPAMDASRSFTVALEGGGLVPVGPTDFYLDRPGFVIGGLGPAAVWAGGIHQLVDLVASGLARFAPTAHQLRRVGVMDQARWEAEAAVRLALDAVTSERPGWQHEVAHARTAVATAADRALDEAAKVVGPGGLSRNARLARAIADLGIYVRQHHLDGELEQAGRRALSR